MIGYNYLRTWIWFWEIKNFLEKVKCSTYDCLKKILEVKPIIARNYSNSHPICHKSLKNVQISARKEVSKTG